MSDTQSSSLALQLLLHDLEELESQQKDKQALGEPTDLEFAITRLREDIQTAQIRLQDSILAQSTIAAVATDQNLLASIKSEENLAIRDRGYALDLNRNDGEIEQQDEAQENDEEDAISLIMGDLMSRIPLQNTLDNGESLSLPAYRPQVLEIKKECTGCLEMTEDIMFEGACGHSFCLACVRQLLLGATTNEEMYPPRCCGTPVSPATIMRVLNYQELRAFCEKAMEWTSKERLYCANPACSKFISGSNIKDQIGTCKDCNTQTHLVCRSIAHPGIDCPDDDALQGVLELASAEEWRRCNNCRAMVELHYGCNHITCRCGHEFCYTCGEVWKTCQCANWHEDRLITAANDAINEELPLDADENARHDMLQRVMEDLRHNEDFGCEHHRAQQWKWRCHGDLECAVCYQVMPEYIFMCTNCRMRACWRCRRHRLR